jgi:hypothetical protein
MTPGSYSLPGLLVIRLGLRVSSKRIRGQEGGLPWRERKPRGKWPITYGKSRERNGGARIFQCRMLDATARIAHAREKRVVNPQIIKSEVRDSEVGRSIWRTFLG